MKQILIFCCMAVPAALPVAAVSLRALASGATLSAFPAVTQDYPPGRQKKFAQQHESGPSIIHKGSAHTRVTRGRRHRREGKAAGNTNKPANKRPALNPQPLPPRRVPTN